MMLTDSEIAKIFEVDSIWVRVNHPEWIIAHNLIPDAPNISLPALMDLIKHNAACVSLVSAWVQSIFKNSKLIKPNDKTIYHIVKENGDIIGSGNTQLEAWESVAIEYDRI